MSGHDWRVSRLEVLHALYKRDAHTESLGSFKQSEALAFATALEYALSLFDPRPQSNTPLSDALSGPPPLPRFKSGMRGER